MSRLGIQVSLVRREWLDVRTVTLASLVLIAVACVVVRWVLGRQFDEWTGPEWATGGAAAARYLDGFVPFSVALVAALVASDLVAGEIASRRIDALALLPVRASRIWWAKFTVLAGVLTLAAVWAFLVQTFTLAAIDGWSAAEPFVQSAVSSQEHQTGALGAVAAFVASVLLVSSLGLRGLSAALGGVLLFAACVVVGGMALQTLLGRTLLGSPPAEMANLALASMAVVFLTASAASFSWGRVHIGRARAVRVAVWSSLAMTGVMTAAWAGVTSHAGPGERFSELEPYVYVSPDGRHVAMQWQNTIGTGCSTRILDITSGVAVELDSGNARFMGWDDDGRARLVRSAGASVEILTCDAATGALVTATTQSVSDYCADANRRYREKQAAAGSPTTWTRWDFARRPEDPAIWRVYAKDRPSRDVRSVMRPVVMHGPNPRVLVAPDADHLVRLDPATGDTEALIESTGTFANAVALSWSATRVPMRTPTRRFFIDLDARTVAPLPEDISDPGWPVDGAKGRIWHMRVRDARSGALVDLVSGTRVALRPATTSDPRIASLPDGGVVVVHDDGSAEHFGPSLECIPFTGAAARQESSR
ncbi:MAG: ABC transporter permease [Planctomycetes bacterium]|nr:ABC transporter permease [Planctomycetota bacterium]